MGGKVRALDSKGEPIVKGSGVGHQGNQRGSELHLLTPRGGPPVKGLVVGNQGNQKSYKMEG